MPSNAPFIHQNDVKDNDERHEWIMDVITDLRQYAQINHLPALADQLENALLICAVETENLKGMLAPDTRVA